MLGFAATPLIAGRRFDALPVTAAGIPTPGPVDQLGRPPNRTHCARYGQLVQMVSEPAVQLRSGHLDSADSTSVRRDSESRRELYGGAADDRRAIGA
jgi:hypothetical protein